MSFRDDQDALHERVKALEVELEDERSRRRAAEEKVKELVADADRLQAERADALRQREARARRRSLLVIALLGLTAVAAGGFASARYDDAARLHRALDGGGNEHKLRAQHRMVVIGWALNVAAAAAAAVAVLLILLQRRGTAFLAVAAASVLLLVSLLGSPDNHLEMMTKVGLVLGGAAAFKQWDPPARRRA